MIILERAGGRICIDYRRVAERGKTFKIYSNEAHVEQTQQYHEAPYNHNNKQTCTQFRTATNIVFDQYNITTMYYSHTFVFCVVVIEVIQQGHLW